MISIQTPLRPIIVPDLLSKTCTCSTLHTNPSCPAHGPLWTRHIMNRLPLIAVCVMVKNERKTLPRLFASVKEFADCAVIMDTGSTDGTLEYLRRLEEEQPPLPVEVFEARFENFGSSRTQLMAHARGKAHWLLLLDADHTLRLLDQDCSVPRESLDRTVSAYSIRHSGDVQYFNTRLVAGDRDWRYIGVTHEYLEGGGDAVKLAGVVLDHHADGGARADKFERDERLLSAELKKDYHNVRTVFYLANTKRDLGHFSDARELYLRRAAMGGWDEEVFVAALEAAKICKDPLEYWECWVMRPTRAEPLFYLEQRYRDLGEEVYALNVLKLREKIPVPQDVLFVELRCYGDKATGICPSWQFVPGWWGEEEEQFYAKMATLMPNFPDASHPERGRGLFVEVGTFLGRSFACFDYYANKVNKRGCHMVAVDTFQGTQSEPTEKSAVEKLGGKMEAKFGANMLRAGVVDYSVVATDSLRAAPMIRDRAADFIFIDAEHTETAVTADIAAWIQKVRMGGYIGGHDYDRPEVAAAVQKKFASGRIKVEGRCWVVQVREND